MVLIPYANSNKPKKFKLTEYPKKYKNKLAKKTGARLQKDKSITYPPNPIHYYRINTLLDQLKLGYKMKKFISQFEDYTKKQVELKENGDKNFELSTEGLYGFQKKDVKFMLHGKRVLNCNEMGCGILVIFLSSLLSNCLSE